MAGIFALLGGGRVAWLIFMYMVVFFCFFHSFNCFKPFQSPCRFSLSNWGGQKTNALWKLTWNSEKEKKVKRGKSHKNVRRQWREIEEKNKDGKKCKSCGKRKEGGGRNRNRISLIYLNIWFFNNQTKNKWEIKQQHSASPEQREMMDYCEHNKTPFTRTFHTLSFFGKGTHEMNIEHVDNFFLRLAFWYGISRSPLLPRHPLFHGMISSSSSSSSVSATLRSNLDHRVRRQPLLPLVLRLLLQAAAWARLGGKQDNFDWKGFCCVRQWWINLRIYRLVNPQPAGPKIVGWASVSHC